MDAYSRPGVAAVLRQLHTNPGGLTHQAARKRLLDEPEGGLGKTLRFGFWLRAVGNDVTCLLLLLALVVTIALGARGSIAAVAVALGLNLWAHWRGQRALHGVGRTLERQLQQSITVSRSGAKLQLPARELVRGDIISLHAHDIIPADVRLIETSRLRLTGRNQAHTILKTAAAGGDNLVLAGAKVASGEGRGVVLALGRRTSMGRQLIAEASVLPLPHLLTRLQRWSLVLFTGLAVVVAVAAGRLQLPTADYLRTISTLAVSLVPMALSIQLVTLRAVPANRQRWLVHFSAAICAAKTALAGVSILGLFIWHTPLGVTIPQLVLLDAVALLLPLTAIAGSNAASLLHRTDTHRLLYFGVLNGLLAYGVFWLFFWRHGISPQHIVPTSNLYLHASTTAFIGLVLGSYVNLYFAVEKRLRPDPRLQRAIVLTAGALLVGLYLPALRLYTTGWPLGPLDWLSALLPALILLGCQLFERATRHHSRHALLAKHSPQTLKKHLKPVRDL